MRARASTVGGHLHDAFVDQVLSSSLMVVTDRAKNAATKNQKRIAWLKSGEIPQYMYQVRTSYTRHGLILNLSSFPDISGEETHTYSRGSLFGAWASTVSIASEVTQGFHQKAPPQRLQPSANRNTRADIHCSTSCP